MLSCKYICFYTTFPIIVLPFGSGTLGRDEAVENITCDGYCLMIQCGGTNIRPVSFIDISECLPWISQIILFSFLEAETQQ